MDLYHKSGNMGHALSEYHLGDSYQNGLRGIFVWFFVAKLLLGVQISASFLDPWCKWVRGVKVSALDFCPGDRGSIPRLVEMFINLKCSFRMRPWEVSTREGLLPARGHTHYVLNVVCGASCAIYINCPRQLALQCCERKWL